MSFSIVLQIVKLANPRVESELTIRTSYFGLGKGKTVVAKYDELEIM